MSVDQIKKDKENATASIDANASTTESNGSEGVAKPEEKKEEEKPKQEATQSEFSAMKQEELMKEKLLAGVVRIYEQHEVNPLLAQQIVTFLPRYEQLFVPQ